MMNLSMYPVMRVSDGPILGTGEVTMYEASLLDREKAWIYNSAGGNPQRTPSWTIRQAQGDGPLQIWKGTYRTADEALPVIQRFFEAQAQKKTATLNA